jgi:hypothetical protein
MQIIVFTELGIIWYYVSNIGKKLLSDSKKIIRLKEICSEIGEDIGFSLKQ